MPALRVTLNEKRVDGIGHFSLLSKYIPQVLSKQGESCQVHIGTVECEF